ncbi:MAG TPA: hypothetical protein VLZ74_08715 [Methylocella sp.]|nr:hypothetical protein [Methylocella sp.]
MKSQISFVAVGLVVATTALGFATVGPLPAPNTAREIVPVRIVDSTDTAARRVYCYNGIRGESGSLSRGWVCVPEDKRSLTN